MAFTTLRRVTGVAALAVLTGTGALALAGPAAALAPQTRYVATNGDDGTDPVNDCTAPAKPCKTIQHAVDEASTGDTISVGAGAYAENVLIGRSLTVVGAGASSTTVTGSDQTDPTVFIEPLAESTSTPTVTLRGLSVSHNHQAPGVVVEAADVSVIDSMISDNLDGGLLALLSTVHVLHSSITHTAEGEGGVMVVASDATVAQSTIDSNATAGVTILAASIMGGLARAISADAPVPPSIAHITASTVSGNQVGGVVNYGGRVAVDTSTVAGNVGGGVVNIAGSAAVLRSTVTGTKPFPGEDTTEQGGLIEIDPSAPALVPNSTERAAIGKSFANLIAGRSAVVRHASRRLVADAAPTTGLSVAASVVADQVGRPDCFGPVTDEGYNLSSDAANSCKFSAAAHSISKTAAKLGPLADNGGATKTEKPLKGSPAIDGVAAGKAGCLSAASDQRGIARPQPAGGACDIGAVELAAKAIVIHPRSLPHGTVGEAYHATLTATGGAYPTYAWSIAPGSSLPDGLSLGSTGHITGTPTKAGRYSVVVSVDDPVRKRYTIVIEDATGTNGNGDEPISATGAPVGSMTAFAGGSILAGFLLMAGAGRLSRGHERRRTSA